MTSTNRPSDNVILIQTTLPDYRAPVLSYVIDKLGSRFRILHGDGFFHAAVKSRALFPSNSEQIKNRYFLKHNVLFQTFDWRRALNAKVVIFEFNPRILSNWLIAGARRLNGKPNLMWGHAWARSGPASRTEPIRNALRKLADGMILYTYSDRDAIGPRARHAQLFVAPNSLYPKAALTFDTSSARNSFIYVGRQVADKKVEVAIRAMAEAVKDPGFGADLVIVGEGPTLENNKALAQSLGVEARIFFLGHIGAREKLEALYGMAIASLSPGYVGLSLTQSLGFGVPMIISRDEPHAPEIEAAREGENCLFFNTDQPESLARVMALMASERAAWAARGPRIAEFCRERYSTEAMGEGFLAAIRFAESLAAKATR